MLASAHVRGAIRSLRNFFSWLTFFVCVLLMAGCSADSPVTAIPPSPVPTLTPPSEYMLAVQAVDGTLGGTGYSQLADVYALRGERYAASAYYAATARELDSAQMWQLVVDNLLAQRDWSAARDALEALLSSKPADPASNYQLGILLAVHNSREAYGYLTRAAADPEVGPAAELLQTAIMGTEVDVPSVQYLQIGMALASLEQWGLAEQAFALTTAFDPTYAEAWAYLGLARVQQGKDAMPDLVRALSLAPDSADALLLIGLVEQIQGDYPAALELMLRAQALDPENPAIAAELGNTYRLTGDYAAAEQWFQAAAGLASEDSQFMTFLAMFYLEAGYDLDSDGFAFLQQAASQQPENAELQAAYAWGLFNQGDAQAAQETIARARFLEPDNPQVLYYQGLLYQATNRYDLAVDILLEVLHHPAPEGFDALARRVLERLR